MRWSPKDELSVTLPRGASQRQAEQFINQNLDWVLSNKPTTAQLSIDDSVGRQHVIAESENITRPRLKNYQIQVPVNFATSSHDSQQKLVNLAHKALKLECEEWVLPRVINTLNSNGQQADIHFKKMHSRWGSCSSKKNLNFSLYIAQLPDELIQYVIIHEVAHLTHMNHSQNFWQEVSRSLPDYKSLRAQLKKQRLNLRPNPLS